MRKKNLKIQGLAKLWFAERRQRKRHDYLKAAHTGFGVLFLLRVFVCFFFCSPVFSSASDIFHKTKIKTKTTSLDQMIESSYDFGPKRSPVKLHYTYFKHSQFGGKN